MRQIRNAGFTLIELIVSISLLVLVGIAMLDFQRDVFLFSHIFDTGLTAEQQVRKAFKVTTEEIRTASQSSIGEYPLVEVATSSFVFYSDIDNDGLKERIRYFLSASSSTLNKGVIKPTGNPLVYNAGSETVNSIVSDVTNGTSTPVFNYYDTSYNGTSSPLLNPVPVLLVRLVKITLIVDPNGSRPPEPVTYTTQISMRNLKDNL